RHRRGGGGGAVQRGGAGPGEGEPALDRARERGRRVRASGRRRTPARGRRDAARHARAGPRARAARSGAAARRAAARGRQRDAGAGSERVSSGAAVGVRAEKLSHRYGRRATGVDGLAFAFDGHGTVAVTGPNGSGKSTLLRIIAGLLRPTEGATTVIVDGRECPAARRRDFLGLATPELSFYEEFSAVENLAFAAEARRLAAPRRAADVALAVVGLAARAGDRVAAYSSGMKQRLRLAFALLHEPPLLLLDEPGSH